MSGQQRSDRENFWGQPRKCGWCAVVSKQFWPGTLPHSNKTEESSPKKQRPAPSPASRSCRYLTSLPFSQRYQSTPPPRLLLCTAQYPHHSINNSSKSSLLQQTSTPGRRAFRFATTPVVLLPTRLVDCHACSIIVLPKQLSHLKSC